MYYIYLIVNNANGKTYVGQRKSSKEWYEDRYMGSGILLAKAKKKYGIENFEKFLIQHCNTKEETDKAERFWIAEYRNRGKAEYNIASGGHGGCGIGENHPMYGKHHTEEAKRKNSEAHKGRVCSDKTKQKISEANKGHPGYWLGKHHSEEIRKKISESERGKHLSEETKRNISKGCIGKPKNRQVSHWKLVDGKRVYY